MSAQPYLGITGLSTTAEVDFLAEIIRLLPPLPSHHLCIGLLISRATFQGQPSPMPRYAEGTMVYSLIDTLSELATVALHFNSRDTAPLSRQVAELLDRDSIYARNRCRRIQVNIGTPDVGELEIIRTRYPLLQLILQVPLWSPQLSTDAHLEEFIQVYRQYVDYFLLDPSGGRGTPIDEGGLRRSAALVRNFPQTTFGIAGGLQGDTVAQLVQQFTELAGTNAFALDSEGKLRGGIHAGRKVGDRLNPTKVWGYLEGALSGLGQVPQGRP